MVNRKLAWFVTFIVFLNTLLNFTHGFCHWKLGVIPNTWQSFFILIVIFLAPIAAAILFWTSLAKKGAALLTASMLASGIFGLLYHYVLITPDHVGHLPSGEFQKAFQATAETLLWVELLGAITGTLAFFRINKS